MSEENSLFARLVFSESYERLELEDFPQHNVFLVCARSSIFFAFCFITWVKNVQMDFYIQNNDGIDAFACSVLEDGSDLMKPHMDGLSDLDSSLEHTANNEDRANVLTVVLPSETSFDDYLNALQQRDPAEAPMPENEVYQVCLSDHHESLNERNPVAASLVRSYSAPESFLLASRHNDPDMSSMSLEEMELRHLDVDNSSKAPLDSQPKVNRSNSSASDILASLLPSLTRDSESVFGLASLEQALAVKRIPSFNVESLSSEIVVDANGLGSRITTGTHELLRTLSRGSSSTISKGIPSPSSTLCASDKSSDRLKILGHDDDSNIRLHMDAQQSSRAALCSLIDCLGISLTLPDIGQGNMQSAPRYPPLQRSQSSHVLGQFRTQNALHTHLEDMPSGGLAVNLESFGNCHQVLGLSDTSGGSSISDMHRILSTGDRQVYHGAKSRCVESTCKKSTRADIGHYTSEERKIRLHRYRQKRSERNFNKKIKYACRKTLADSRQRIRGRFARTIEDSEERPMTKNGCSHDHYERVVGNGGFWGHILKSYGEIS